jgi:hypothetical protein
LLQGGPGCIVRAPGRKRPPYTHLDAGKPLEPALPKPVFPKGDLGLNCVAQWVIMGTDWAISRVTA